MAQAPVYRTGAGPPTDEELSGRRTRIAGGEEDLARRVRAGKPLQPGQRKKGRERRRRHRGLQQRHRPRMAQQAAMMGRMVVPVFRGERRRLRENQCAQKQHDERNARDAPSPE